ncbi:hypothetical protein [Planctomycetes bacterium K23_9]
MTISAFFFLASVILLFIVDVRFFSADSAVSPNSPLSDKLLWLTGIAMLFAFGFLQSYLCKRELRKSNR